MKKIETDYSYDYRFSVGKITGGKFFAEFSTFRFEADTPGEAIKGVAEEIEKDFEVCDEKD